MQVMNDGPAIELWCHRRGSMTTLRAGGPRSRLQVGYAEQARRNPCCDAQLLSGWSRLALGP
jgi:hypothetical protein